MIFLIKTNFVFPSRSYQKFFSESTQTSLKFNNKNGFPKTIPLVEQWRKRRYFFLTKISPVECKHLSLSTLLGQAFVTLWWTLLSYALVDLSSLYYDILLGAQTLWQREIDCAFTWCFKLFRVCSDLFFLYHTILAVFYTFFIITTRLEILFVHTMNQSYQGTYFHMFDYTDLFCVMNYYNFEMYTDWFLH